MTSRSPRPGEPDLRLDHELTDNAVVQSDSAAATPQDGDEAPPDTNPPTRVTDLHRLHMLSMIAEQVGEGVAVVDNDTWCLYANPTFARMHAATPEQLQTTHFSALYSPEEWNGPVQSLMQEAMIRGVGRAELTRRRVDGTTFAAHVTLSLLHDEGGILVGRILCVQDITVRKQLESQLHRAALHDPLTDLPNRRLLLDRLEHALAVAERLATSVALLFIDLDRFKSVNDTYGHELGDQLLVRVSDRLEGCLREADTLARLGGDEFVVLLEGLTEPDHTAKTGRRMLDAVAQPFKLDMATIRITASIGIAVAGSGSPRSLLHAADGAMYRAKSNGPGQLVTDW